MTNTFATLGLAEPIVRALADKKYTTPSPIQERAIPELLQGRDLWGCAQTGTGKTAAFALPILHRLSAGAGKTESRCPRVLVLTPTRELAGQIADNFAAYGKYLPLRYTVIFGGVGTSRQIESLNRGVDVLVATPGRLLDLMSQQAVHLRKVEVFVLDEADRMLDMGFAPDVNRVMARLPEQRQSLLFSATMPDAIRQIAENLLKDPVRVEVAPVASTAERIEQRVCHVAQSAKSALLKHWIGQNRDGLVLVFTRTKHGANNLARKLAVDGREPGVLHGNKSQNARERALEDFRQGRSRVLVATDIAARGIDVKGISLVINYDVPVEPEAYVHRIGRTARAGAEGLALTFCGESERSQLRAIEKLIRKTIPVEPHGFENVKEERKEHPAPQHRRRTSGRFRSSRPSTRR
ncbi:MAG: DEAD/DEAH box helicase [Terrimicrobiaceae bacterium]